MRTRSNRTAADAATSNESISDVLNAPRKTRSTAKAQPPREATAAKKQAPKGKGKATAGEKKGQLQDTRVDHEDATAEEGKADADVDAAHQALVRAVEIKEAEIMDKLQAGYKFDVVRDAPTPGDVVTAKPTEDATSDEDDTRDRDGAGMEKSTEDAAGDQEREDDTDFGADAIDKHSVFDVKELMSDEEWAKKLAAFDDALEDENASLDDAYGSVGFITQKQNDEPAAEESDVARGRNPVPPATSVRSIDLATLRRPTPNVHKTPVQDPEYSPQPPSRPSQEQSAEELRAAVDAELRTMFLPELWVAWEPFPPPTEDGRFPGDKGLGGDTLFLWRQSNGKPWKFWGAGLMPGESQDWHSQVAWIVEKPHSFDKYDLPAGWIPARWTDRHGVEETGDGSEDDYEAAEADRKRLLGKSVRFASEVAEEEQEQEDLKEMLEDERELTGQRKGKRKATSDDELEPSNNGAATSRSAGSKGKQKAKEKSKPKKQSGRANPVGEDTDEEADEEADDESSNKPGPLGAEGVREAQALYTKYLADVEELAKKHGKSATAVHSVVGDVERKFRGANLFNIYQCWYSATKPRPAHAADGEAWVKFVRQEYEKQFDDLPEEVRDDKATRRTHLSEVVDWYKEKIGLAMDARREDGRVAGTAAGLTKPFINMSTQIYNQTGCQIFGYIIDTRGDHAAMWGGSPQYAAVREKHATSINDQLDDLKNLFRTEDRIGRGLKVSKALFKINWDRGSRETCRDRHRRVFTEYMRGELGSIAHQQGQLQAKDASAFRMSWAWAGYALKYQVSIRNWPNSLVEKAIWPKKGFKLSRIEDATIRRMVRAVERKMGFRWQPWADEDVEEQKDNEDEHDDSEEEDGERQVNREKGKDDGEEEDEDEGDDDMPVVEIVPWTDEEKSRPVELMGSIPLITSANGTVLARLDQVESHLKRVGKKSAHGQNSGQKREHEESAEDSEDEARSSKRPKPTKPTPKPTKRTGKNTAKGRVQDGEDGEEERPHPTRKLHPTQSARVEEEDVRTHKPTSGVDESDDSLELRRPPVSRRREKLREESDRDIGSPEQARPLAPLPKRAQQASEASAAAPLGESITSPPHKRQKLDGGRSNAGKRKHTEPLGQEAGPSRVQQGDTLDGGGQTATAFRFIANKLRDCPVFFGTGLRVARWDKPEHKYIHYLAEGNWRKVPEGFLPVIVGEKDLKNYNDQVDQFFPSYD